MVTAQQMVNDLNLGKENEKSFREVIEKILRALGNDHEEKDKLQGQYEELRDEFHRGSPEFREELFKELDQKLYQRAFDIQAKDCGNQKNVGKNGGPNPRRLLIDNKWNLTEINGRIRRN